MPVSDTQVEEALYKSCGIISAAAKILGIGRVGLSKRIKGNEALKEVLESFRESNVDMAETILFKRMRWANQMSTEDKETGEVAVPPSTEDIKIVLSYLKLQGKHRGYTERHELVPGGDEPISDEFL